MTKPTDKPVRAAVARMIEDRAERERAREAAKTDAQKAADELKRRKRQYASAIPTVTAQVQQAMKGWETDLHTGNFEPELDTDVEQILIPGQRPMVQLAHLSFEFEHASGPMVANIAFATLPNEDASDGYVVALYGTGESPVLTAYKKWQIIGFDVGAVDAAVEEIIEILRNRRVVRSG
jgi:hypothetical protein